MIERPIGFVSIAAAVLLLGLAGCASPGGDGSFAYVPPDIAAPPIAGSDLPRCSMIADPNARCIQDAHAAGRGPRASASPAAGSAALPFALSAEDRDAIGRIAYAEAGNQGEEGIAAVIFCVLNRVNSGLFQGSVQAVIDARNQFEPATRVGGWRRLPPPAGHSGQTGSCRPSPARRGSGSACPPAARHAMPEAAGVAPTMRAIEPSRSRSSPLAADHSSRRSEAPGSSSHGTSIPAFWDPCPGAVRQSTSIREHGLVRFG